MTKSCPDFNLIPKPRTLKPEPMQSQYQRRKVMQFPPKVAEVCVQIRRPTRAELNESGIKEKCKNFGPLMNVGCAKGSRAKDFRSLCMGLLQPSPYPIHPISITKLETRRSLV